MITYTENTKNSYASYHSYRDIDEIVNFIDSIKLSCPPGHEGISANGGDGDENVKLAYARFL